jgi:hypothetical protein
VREALFVSSQQSLLGQAEPESIPKPDRSRVRTR